MTAPGGEASVEEHRLEFTGRAGEYFRIWIVNLCLTLLTLGVYSPWAKVRSRRYFYSNLLLDGSPFLYTADPLRILIGRAIVLAFAAVYLVSGALSPTFGAVMGVLLFLFTPWLLVCSLAFQRRNSMYRNVRFGFVGSVGEAALLLIGAPLIASVSFGLALPWIQGWQQQFAIGNTRYGTTRAGFELRPWPYYRAFLEMLGVGLGLAVLGGLAALALVALLPDFLGAGSAASFLLPIGLVWVGVYAVFRARMTNLMYANARLGQVRLVSRLRARELAWIYATNAAMVVLSLGLLLPLALIRLARYRASRLDVLARGGLGGFVASSEDPRGGEFADEAAGFFDFDVGL